MKRTHWLICATAALAVLVAGCGGAAQKPSAPAASTEAAAPPAENKREAAGTALPFEVIEASMLPPELAAWAEMKELPTATPSARVGDNLYVAVVGGRESVGAPAIAVEQVEFVAQPATVTVKAVVTPGRTGAESSTFPRAFVRIPYPASQPVPVVWTHVAVEAAEKTGGSTLTVTPLPEAALPASLSAWRTSTVQVPGAVARFVDGALYVMVSAGQRNTGGYAVEIEGIEVRENTVHVSALLRSPGPSAMVTQAITYPKAYAKVDLPGTGEPPVIVDWK